MIDRMELPSDLYARHTDKDGKTFVQEHRVWNRDRFVRMAHERAAEIGGKSKFEQISKHQYQQERVK